MDVSIIIVNYNTFQLTSNCIQSIYKKSEGFTFEIILVDNASTECDANDFKNIFPDITLVINNENVGFARGNNCGIKYAKGRLLLLLNSDTELVNNAISLCVKFLYDNTQVGAVTTRLQFPSGVVQHNCQRFPSVQYQLLELLRLQKIFPAFNSKLMGSFFNYKEIAYPDWIWGTFFLFRKDILLQLPDKKLPDETFMYGEDMEWCMEFSKLSFLIAFIPDGIVMHIGGASKADKQVLMETNREIFLKNYYSWWNRSLIRLLDKLL